MSAFRTVLLLAMAVTVAQGYRTFRSRIPNGHRVFVNDVIWEGVGHTNSRGAGPLNPFGLDFLKANYRWTVPLCQLDSDKDGRRNGQELGDHNCTWTEGSPAPNGTVTHPGIRG